MQTLDRILERFEQLSAVPRGTKQEAGLRAWLQTWAEDQGLKSRTDAIGNLLIEVPASSGSEGKPAVILQGHMDMVWQKAPGVEHDFTRDPIRVLQEGKWLTADGTTLGADNGIAIALMMAIAEDKGLKHPPLEFLLTVEEELNVVGADNIDPGLITGKTLINLDSEDDGVFTIGCAGGGTLYITQPVEWAAVEVSMSFLLLKVAGLRGGHSGGDIHKNRANANKLMARALAELQKELPIRLAFLKGGAVRNAIPREAEAIFALPEGQQETCREKMRELEEVIRSEYAVTESGLAITLEPASPTEKTVTAADSRRMVHLLQALPNGVSAMSAEVDGFVETSNNIGIMELLEDGFHVVSNHRSSVASRLEEIISRVEAVVELAGAQGIRNKVNEPWRPNRESPLLKKCVEVYRECFGEGPKVELTHGGLECGLLSRRCGGLDAISLGPTIENAHSPDERLYVPSVERVWEFLVRLLEGFTTENTEPTES